jgi:molybdopterin-guanine dinucleotide biosynthesis protein A
VVVPKINGYYEPLCAVYTKSCLKTIQKKIKKNQLSIKEIYSEFRLNEVDEDELKMIDPDLISFFNINTKNDYNKAKELYLKYEGKLTDAFQS